MTWDKSKISKIEIEGYHHEHLTSTSKQQKHWYKSVFVSFTYRRILIKLLPTCSGLKSLTTGTAPHCPVANLKARAEPKTNGVRRSHINIEGSTVVVLSGAVQGTVARSNRTNKHAPDTKRNVGGRITDDNTNRSRCHVAIMRILERDRFQKSTNSTEILLFCYIYVRGEHKLQEIHRE